jgi:5'-methylthioadenosine phosphorylase
MDCDIIGMTALPEAKLAREAEIHYAVVACSTDYDCWHEGEESVTIEMVVNNLTQNVGRAKQIIRLAIPKIAELIQAGCGCDSALENAIMTDRSKIPAASIEKLGLLVNKYL